MRRRARAKLGLAMAGIAAVLGSAPPASAAVPHVVQPGETLWSIAAANNFTTRTVAAFNGLSEDALVVEGQTIQIPTLEEGAAALESAGITPGTDSSSTTIGSHVVQPGESLSSIAAANGLTISDLAAANGLAEDALLIIGQTIQVPGSSSSTTTSSSTSASAGSHVVQRGESLSSIASANGLSIESLSSANGLASDALLIIGQTIEIPSAMSSSSSTDASLTNSIPPAPGMGHVPSPYGELHLAPAAADSWNAMREEALSIYGRDIYPGGYLSAYRTYEQQAYLYDLYLSGQGAPANPPGTSSHETGNAVDLETPEMRTVIDEIGWKYHWGKIHGPTEWWHVDYLGG
jgi:LysM repeat protein